ncbi:hypothetical protein AXF42_Ash021345 [Apostasia shenzhenica]|uniref:Uncharacterized protein n=1 Tax=Apostasia shenzhenica TaxID=1088818 RepID=A0A2H9ZSL4_9ASPA|nr:hypothetical protein AXF42_Ash021345 [Apostasia shenzhenica]
MSRLPVLVEFGRLSATDISALASMKNAANRDTWCELQNPANHRVFERKLRPRPSGRGHACLVVRRRVAPAVACVRSTKNRQHESGCGVWPSACASGGLKSALSLVGPSPDEGGGSIGMNRFVAFSLRRRHQMMTELTPCHGHCYPGDGAALVVATSGAPQRRNGPSPWKGAPGRVRAPYGRTLLATRGAVAESGCLGMQPNRGAGGGGDAPRPDAERRRRWSAARTRGAGVARAWRRPESPMLLIAQRAYSAATRSGLYRERALPRRASRAPSCSSPNGPRAPHPTVLETRTKESTCVRADAAKPGRRKEPDAWDTLFGEHHGTDSDLCEGFEWSMSVGPERWLNYA